MGDPALSIEYRRKRGAEKSGTGILVLLQPDVQAVLLETSESVIWFYRHIVSFLLVFCSEQSYSTALMPSNPFAVTCPALHKGFVFLLCFLWIEAWDAW